MTTRREALARRRAAMGFTQESLAARLGIERSTVCRWERGTVTPMPWHQPKLATALDLSPEELADVLGNDHGQPACSSPSGPGTTEPVVAMPGQLSLRGYRSPDVVARIQATAQAFQAADRRVGGGVLYPSVTQYLNVEISPLLLDPGDGMDGSALFAAAASMTEIAGWMSHDGGRDNLAQRYFDKAFRLAVASRNQSLTGNACASMAHLAVELGQSDNALRIAKDGLDRSRAESGTKRLLARLHSMRARAFALQGDRSSCSEELHVSEQTLADADHEMTAEWIANFDDASLASEAALCFLTLAEYREAERQAREVIRIRSGDRVRSRAFGQLTLANVLLEAGRPEEAALLGHEVCQLTTSLTSARVAHRLNELARALAPVGGVPEVATFLEAVGPLSYIPTERKGRTLAWPV